MQATILNIQRFSTEDGPGNRSTVFFKGCPLRCAWCHNPESISPHPQLTWVADRCLQCEACLRACPQAALSRLENNIRIDRSLCRACGTCVEVCPGAALEMLGYQVQLVPLADELEKDRAFYEQSGGGVTLSGGEPLRQPAFAQALLQELNQRGIQTALDTCCACDEQTFLAAARMTDVLLLDLKILDAESHRMHTGAQNALILKNILAAAELVRCYPHKRLWLRTPLIPGATATQQNLQAIGAFIRDNLSDVLERWELCAFNNLCRDKYRRLDIHWPYQDSELITLIEMNTFVMWAQTSGIQPSLVVPTGATRLQEQIKEAGA